MQTEVIRCDFAACDRVSSPLPTSQSAGEARREALEVQEWAAWRVSRGGRIFDFCESHGPSEDWISLQSAVRL